MHIEPNRELVPETVKHVPNRKFQSVAEFNKDSERRKMEQGESKLWLNNLQFSLKKKKRIDRNASSRETW